MEILITKALECSSRIKINFNGGDLSSNAGLHLIKEFARRLRFVNI